MYDLDEHVLCVYIYIYIHFQWFVQLRRMMVVAIFFRFLFFSLLINALSSREPWILPRSTSFHHAFEFFHARAKVSHLSSATSLTLPSLLPWVINGTACHDDLFLLMNGFLNQEKWALKIVDSWGIKPPAGILEGSHLWFGSYDECLHSLYLPKNHSHVRQPFATKYCTISNQVDDDDQVFLQKPALIMGVCLPHSCRSTDIQMKSLYIQCPSERRHASIGAIFTLSLIVLLSLFVCFAGFIPRLREYSAISTLKRIFSFDRTHSTYAFFNGIRAMSLFWIILGHSFLFHLVVADNVLHVLDTLQNSSAIQLLLGAAFGVDTFFFISGFLAVVVFINTFQDQSKFLEEWERRSGILFISDAFHLRTSIRLLSPSVLSFDSDIDIRLIGEYLSNAMDGRWTDLSDIQWFRSRCLSTTMVDNDFVLE